MHSMMWSDQVDEVAYWKDYVKVNQQFADKVMDRYKPGDQSKFNTCDTIV